MSVMVATGVAQQPEAKVGSQYCFFLGCLKILFLIWELGMVSARTLYALELQAIVSCLE